MITKIRKILDSIEDLEINIYKCRCNDKNTFLITIKSQKYVKLILT